MYLLHCPQPLPANIDLQHTHLNSHLLVQYDRHGLAEWSEIDSVARMPTNTRSLHFALGRCVQSLASSNLTTNSMYAVKKDIATAKHAAMHRQLAIDHLKSQMALF